MPKRIDNVIESKGVLLLGAGVAGLFAALKLAPFPALVLAGSRPGVSGSSAWAQGGIAAAMDPTDSWRFHAEDTLAAGAGICDVEVAEFVAREAQARIEDLISYGAPFDRKTRRHARARPGSCAFRQPHRARERRPRRSRSHPHACRTRAGDIFYQAARGLPRTRTRDGKRQGHRVIWRATGCRSSTHVSFCSARPPSSSPPAALGALFAVTTRPA